MERFYRKKSGAGELLVKEKKGLFLGWNIFFLGGGQRRREKGKDFYHVDCLASFGYKGWKGLTVTDYLIQKFQTG